MNHARKIIHIDADCFYAAIEMRDNPSWRNRPLAVGGSTDRRGVIATCNYEARAFGVHSAMASFQALKLCPELLLVPGRMSAYKEASRAMHKIFSDYTDLIEPLSLDEAYLDVSASERCSASATLMAEEIRARVEKSLQITVSAGVASNKFLAKVASDWRKPNGMTVIQPGEEEEFTAQLPIAKIPGIGKVGAQRLLDAGIETCLDARAWSVEQLDQHFGQLGERLYCLCRGRDDRPVQVSRERKSLSVEHTYSRDYYGFDACVERLPELMAELAGRLHKHFQTIGTEQQSDQRIVKLLIKVKFSNFSGTTAECSGAELSLESFQLLLKQALGRADADLGVRLLGLGVRFERRDVQALSQQIALI